MVRDNDLTERKMLKLTKLYKMSDYQKKECKILNLEEWFAKNCGPKNRTKNSAEYWRNLSEKLRGEPNGEENGY
jgi:hypothetical protein